MIYLRKWATSVRLVCPGHKNIAWLAFRLVLPKQSYQYPEVDLNGPPHYYVFFLHFHSPRRCNCEQLVKARKECRARVSIVDFLRVFAQITETVSIVNTAKEKGTVKKVEFVRELWLTQTFIWDSRNLHITKFWIICISWKFQQNGFKRIFRDWSIRRVETYNSDVVSFF